MVYLKVSDGSETRKLQVTPGEITFDQLKEQLATFFPKTLLTGEASSSDLSLQYCDADGDIITLSSDQELQEALSQLKEDSVWRLYIRAGKGTRKPAGPSPAAAAQRTTQQRRNHCEIGSLFHHLFEPSVKPFGLFSDIWDDLELQLQLLHQLHGDVFSSNTNKADTKNGEERGNGTSEAASKSEEGTTASSPTSSTEKVEDPDEVVKSKPQKEDGTERKPENSESSSGDSSNNGWQTGRFVSWEPRLHVGPFGFFHSHMTPVIYNMAYCSSSPSSSSGTGQSRSRANGEEETKTETQTATASPKAATTAAAPAKEEQVTTDTNQQ